jgi:myo-inositol-1(or 4)-monophosphatase
LVTEADFKCQEVIKSLLSQRFPDHGFLAEEADAVGDRPGEYRWVIDPIDGTTNYSRRFPIFTVSVALCRGDEVIVGAVFDPIRGDLFTARRGRGAQLNGRPIHVSDREQLGEAILGLEWAHDPEPRARTLHLLSIIGAEVQSIRSVGSAALSLCYLAAGFSDVYFNLYLYPWDVAAAALIIEEAGGRLTMLDGQPWELTSGSYLATNGRLHDIALEMLNPG